MKKKRIWKKALQWSLLLLTLLSAALFLFACGTIMQTDAWDAFEPERILGAAQSTIFYDREGREVYRLHGAEDRVSIRLEGLPAYVAQAFVSAEDARFYEHRGVDVIRIAGALWADIKAGGYVQGASTISQQLIKLSHLNAEKTIRRKLEEAVLALRMEQSYSKDEILAMYLNYVYFGGGYYGIEAAANGYFAKPASELTLAEAALLAGILKAPSRYAPHLDAAASVERRNLVLGLMCDYGYISEAERDAARAEKLSLVPQEKKGAGGYYMETAIREATALLGVDREALYTGGYRVYTALDTDLQSFCETIMEDDANFPAPDVQAAIVVQRTNSGLVSALIGGRHSESAAFNRATDIRRQPGSVIKPVLCYAPALELSGWTAASMILDERTVFGDYAPENYDSRYYGYVTMREAVTRSLNIPAVKVLSEIGVERAKAFASKMGVAFHETDESLTLALGGFTYGLSPWMLSGAYNCFASGGVYYAPTVIREIRDGEGTLLYRYDGQGSRVMRGENAFILTSMLQSAVREGTGRRLGELGMDIAGKTGTVGEGESNRDAWMAAYNPDYTCCIWMGYDSAADGSMPAEATGGNYPALVLRALFSYIYEAETAPSFTAPEGVNEVRLDAHALEHEHMAALATAFTPAGSVYTEYFAEGTEPSNTSSYWTIPLPPSRFGVEKDGDGYPYISFYPRQSFVQYELYRVDEWGMPRCIAVFDGTKMAEYTDTEVRAGQSYAYYAKAVHPELVINGKRAESAPTVQLRLEIEALRGPLWEPGHGGGPVGSGGVIDLSEIGLPWTRRR